MAQLSVNAETLFEACAAGDISSLKRFMKDGAYIEKALQTEEHVVNENGQVKRQILNLSLMFLKAVKVGPAELAEYLLLFANRHTIPYEKLINRESVCTAIYNNNNVAVFEKIVAVRPDAVNMEMGHPGVPLTQSIGGSRNTLKFTSDRTPLVRFLLENGANPNSESTTTYRGVRSHLDAAIRDSSLEEVELLLKHGAHVEQSSAIHRAAETGRIDVLELLLQYGADVNEQQHNHEPGYSSKIRTKMKGECGITSDTLNYPKEYWRHETPLHFSVLFRQVEATTWLVEHGADVNIKDSEGWNAIDMAIKMNDAGILETLGISTVAAQE
jgi:hypothetical protein